VDGRREGGERAEDAPILGELAAEELVELGLEDTVGDELHSAMRVSRANKVHSPGCLPHTQRTHTLRFLLIALGTTAAMLVLSVWRVEREGVV
jgi:hypothetical protein